MKGVEKELLHIALSIIEQLAKGEEMLERKPGSPTLERLSSFLTNHITFINYTMKLTSTLIAASCFLASSVLAVGWQDVAKDIRSFEADFASLNKLICGELC